MRACDPKPDLRWSDFIPETFSLDGDGVLFTLLGGYFFSLAIVHQLLRPVEWLVRELGAPLPIPLHRAVLVWAGALFEIAVIAVFVLIEGPRTAERRREPAPRPLPVRAQPALPTAEEEERPAPERPRPELGCIRIMSAEEMDEEDERRPREARRPKREPTVSERNGVTVVRLSREEDEPEQPPLPPGLTEAQWHALPDAAALLEHAIPRIPVRYSCLVLAQLAERLWGAWHRRMPEDWRPGWCLTVLRAWCFGQASLAELDRARAQAGQARRMIRSRSGLSPFPAILAVDAIRSAALQAGFHDAEEIGPEPAFRVLGAFVTLSTLGAPGVQACALIDEVTCDLSDPEADFYEALAERQLEQAEREVVRRVSAELAQLLRRWIPYPWRWSPRWSRGGSTLLAGDARVTLDGWRIREARPDVLPPRSRSRRN